MWVATGAGLTGLLFPSDLFPTGFPSFDPDLLLSDCVAAPVLPWGASMQS